jgi:hypothetical protein
VSEYIRTSTACGQIIEPTSKPLEKMDFMIASSMNFRRRSGASMGIEAAATQPGFGGLCHQLIRIAGHVRNGPFLELHRPDNSPCPTDPPPACLIAISLGAAVITPNGNNGASLTAGGHIDLPQFRVFVRRGGWTNFCRKCKGSTEGGDDDLCSNVIISTTGQHAVMECSYGRAFVRNEGVTFAN